MSILTYSDDSGTYYPGFFIMKINKELNEGITSENFTIEELSTFAHEYIHYLQDISTTCGIMYLVYISKILQVNLFIAGRDESNTLLLPFDLCSQKIENLSEEKDLQSFYLGSDTFKKIHHINKITCEIEEILKEEYGLQMSDIILYYDDNYRYSFGRNAITESMAYTIEQFIFGGTKRKHELPYNACEMICEKNCPRLLENIPVFVAAMELSLMHYHSGKMFWDIVNKINYDNIYFNSVNEFEMYFKSTIDYNLNNMSKEMDEIDKCINFLYPNDFNDVKKACNYIISKLNIGHNERKKGLFISKILESSNPMINMFNNMKIFGLPLICDSSFNIYGGDANLNAVFAPIMLYSFFDDKNKDNNQCFLYPYCKKQKMYCFDDKICSLQPWNQCVKDSLCYFGYYWKRYSLEGKKVKRP